MNSLFKGSEGIENRARITDEERKKRAAFHTDEAEKKIKDIVQQVKRVLGAPLSATVQASPPAAVMQCLA